jgi:hypothetical protein
MIETNMISEAMSQLRPSSRPPKMSQRMLRRRAMAARILGACPSNGYVLG